MSRMNRFVHTGSLIAKTLLTVVLMTVCAGGLSACGKMPGKVDPPASSSGEPYPRTYPDLSTDPRP